MSCFLPLLAGILLAFIAFLPAARAQYAPYQIREQVNAGNYPYAVRLCENALKSDLLPEARLEILFTLGEAQCKTGDENEALRTWERLKREPRVPEDCVLQATLAQAKIRAKNKNTEDRALKNFRLIISRQPEGKFTPEAVIGAVQLLRKQGAYYDAVKQLDDWRPKFSDHPLTKTVEEERAALAKILEQKAAAVSKTPLQEKLVAAENLKKNEKYAEAVRAYTAALLLANDTQPEYWQGVLGQIDCLIGAGQNDAALRMARELSGNRRAPADARARAMLDSGILLLESGDFGAESERILRQFVKNNPEREDIGTGKLYLALALARQRKTDEAAALLNDSDVSETNEDASGNNAFLPEERLRAWITTGKVEYEDILGREKQKNPAVRTADDLFAALRFENAARTYAAAGNASKDINECAYCLFQEARARALAKDFKKSAALYRRFATDARLANTRWAAPALLRAGIMCIARMDDERQGLKFYADVRRIAPKSKEAQEAAYNTALLHLWKDRNEPARKAFEAFMTEYPTSERNAVIKKDYLPQLLSASKSKSNEKTKTKSE